MPYLRFILSPDSDTKVKAFAHKLSTEIPHWYSQLDPRAELGCHPFHVTIVGRMLPSAELTPAQIVDAVLAISRELGPFKLGKGEFPLYMY